MFQVYLPEGYADSLACDDGNNATRRLVCGQNIHWRTMTKTQLAEQLAEARDRSKQDAERTLDLVFAGIATALQNGEQLELRGFGTFKIRDQKARLGRTPQTGETLNIPAKRVPVFKPSKQLAEQVKGQ